MLIVVNIDSMDNKFVNPFVLWAIILLGVIVFFLVVPYGAVLSERVPAWVLVIPALGYWTYFFLGALKLNKQPTASSAAAAELIETGVYGKVRHPIYSADIILAWGIFFVFPSLRLLLSVVWLTVLMVYWSKLEEQALRQKFPQRYQAYAKRVPPFFPKYWDKLFRND